MTEALQGALDFFVRGGFFMLLLLLLSIVAGTVIFLRGFALRESLIMPPDVESAVDGLQPGDSLQRVTIMAQRSNSPLGRIISVCLRHLNWPLQENV